MSDRTPLWRCFYASDPYADFPVDDHPEDTQGWGSQHPLFEFLILNRRPSLIVEVGSWKGRSALHMAAIVARESIDAQILCVDTWLGAPEHILMPEYRESLRIKHGYPQLFHTFMANMVRAGRHDMVTPLPQTSANAAVLLRRLRLAPDLIYIDAAHEYETALQDLRAYYPLRAPGGVLFGDDYPKAGGVVRAVHEFAAQYNLRVVAGGGKFVLTDGDHHQFDGIGLTVQEPPK